MKDVLTDIQSGSFASRWIDEQESGGAEFARLRQQDRNHQIEQVGRDLRAQMAFLNPVVVEAGEAQSAVGSAASGSPVSGPSATEPAAAAAAGAAR